MSLLIPLAVQAAIQRAEVSVQRPCDCVTLGQIILIQSIPLFQGPASVRTPPVADLLWTHVRRLHEAMEVPAAAPDRTGLQVRPETMADWRNS